MNIIHLPPTNTALIESLADLAFIASKRHAPGWLPTREEALEEVTDALEDDKITRVMMDGDTPLGWVSAGLAWSRIWELHPLLVHPDHHRKGIGMALVRDIERFAAQAGALTMTLSTSDETQATTLSQTNLYQNPQAALAQMRVLDPTKGHAVTFWLKAGYTLTGVIPDSEGPGMPSIHFCKALTPQTP